MMNLTIRKFIRIWGSDLQISLQHRLLLWINHSVKYEFYAILSTVLDRLKLQVLNL